ncbi:MAG: metal-sulfur cluster assembly factor [Candidatus Marsarchaeota archaeon]|jgi:metal-sulfur cluster biosynthetic enzyme|nr:metal-sulfur cluster assembly factor [Candidatus Marsarchaeota archaeon]
MEKITIKDVLDALSKCKDPELGFNVVDMGLIYNIKIKDNNIDITMTMTSPMCPVTSIILADVQLRLQAIPEVGKVNINLVWEPMWSPEMMSDNIKYGSINT